MKCASVRLTIAAGLTLGVPTLWAQTALIERGESAKAWTVKASDGVAASVEAIEVDGLCVLRLTYDFQRGAGFCVLRRDVGLPLPANYRLDFAIRGEGPANNLEFKLVSPGGDDVWWVFRRDFEWPAAWKTLTQRARHFKFAWGPSGGTRMERIGAIEFAISASNGGKGHVDLAGLTFELLPETKPPTDAPTVTYSSMRGADAPQSAPAGAPNASGGSKPSPSPSLSGRGVAGASSATFRDGGRLDWRSAETDAMPAVTLDFHAPRELGGVTIEWGEDFAPDYDVSLSSDGKAWERAATVEQGNGGRDMIAIPDGEARLLRVAARRTSRGKGVELKSLQIHGVEWSETPNAFAANVAKASPRGWYPRYLLNEQPYWTVVGVAGDSKEALMDADGAIELEKLGARIEPFLYVDGKLVTWADVKATQTLLDVYLPVPIVTWSAAGLRLDITAFGAGASGDARLFVRYKLTPEAGSAARKCSLLLAIRPFQVLPPWQTLNLTGGVARVKRVLQADQWILLGERLTVGTWNAFDAFGATAGMGCDIIEHLAAGKLPQRTDVADEEGRCSAALRYDFELKPGESRAAYVTVPFHAPANEHPVVFTERDAEARFEAELAKTKVFWSEPLVRARLTLPPEAERIVNTFRSTQAYILINADGPAIQPGSRTYERSWIRDGCLTSTALLYTGHAEKVRQFIEWFAPNQFESGKIPCVVDRRGPDPVPEHDSTGQFIYLVAKYYRFTRDRALLEKMLPRVEAGVRYIESLRAERMTPEYRDGPPEKRACYGIVPESISHEGYSAKPMHSYWDNFFTMRGLKDAAYIAGELGRDELRVRFEKLRDDYRAALIDSIKLAMKNKGVEYIPGCAELGDFDATSTAVALFPCEEGDFLPQPALQNTFDRYYRFFRDRRDGKAEWKDYTPYELRLIGSFVRLGQPERAHELLDFFFADQRPAGWNHWAEVVRNGYSTPGFIGDMPHTWCGTEFVNSVRNMFVTERERDGALVIGAGIRAEWLDAGKAVAIERFPTEHGELSYEIRGGGDRLKLSLKLKGDVPAGGIIWVDTTSRRFTRVEGQDATKATVVDARQIRIVSANAEIEAVLSE